ncbi:hypothetical protein ACFO4N_12870 [Camelliibacillus cellulosilyticus]|uniref:Uncharacterized protein n=1 Tax=Camelliibacillus cellulosilyticus TaxID=2174486 RepID=A0ABV9GNL1_9BACL
MGDLERLQILTEIIGEFKTAIMMDQEAEKTGRLVLEVIQETGDDQLTAAVMNAYMKRTNIESAVHYLNDAISYLHHCIDQVLHHQS